MGRRYSIQLTICVVPVSDWNKEHKNLQFTFVGESSELGL